MDKSTHNSDIY
jgi:WD40 repeat protein